MGALERPHADPVDLAPRFINLLTAPRPVTERLLEVVLSAGFLVTVATIVPDGEDVAAVRSDWPSSTSRPTGLGAPDAACTALTS
jgi:hypothetical protein